ncbi:MAG: hypothetical protein PHX13_10370 [Thiovulaceae bacterium]|nr:hypothetical protein [Sulfurimonadaceae bacterium]
MKEIIYKDVDIYVNEHAKTMSVNPIGERFYFLDCEDEAYIYHEATLTYDTETQKYSIEGIKRFTTKHKGSSFNYHTLLCQHPEELIVKKRFLGFLWQYYSVDGRYKREFHAIYACKHQQYVIEERTQMISQGVVEDEK